MFWLFQKIIFIYTVLKIFFLSGFTCMAKSFIQFKNFKNTQYIYFIDMVRYFAFKMLKIPSPYQIRSQKTMFLINHRSQADFWAHPLILNMRSCVLGRKQVGYLFTIFVGLIKKSTWLFDRSKQIDVQKFNQWLDHKFEQSQRKSLTVYPEGHRMYGIKSVQKQKLKRGMIKYAYLRNIPVQIIMSFGNQNAFNEKKLKVSFGQKVYYKIGKVINPKDYKQANEFVNDVLDEFIRFFDQTYKQSQSGKEYQQTTQKLIDEIKLKLKKQ